MHKDVQNSYTLGQVNKVAITGPHEEVRHFSSLQEHFQKLQLSCYMKFPSNAITELIDLMLTE